MIGFDIYNENLLENPKLSGYNTKKKRDKMICFWFCCCYEIKEKKEKELSERKKSSDSL